MKKGSKKLISALVIAALTVGLCIGAMAIDNYESSNEATPLEYSYTDENGNDHYVGEISSTYTFNK